ncbi:sensor histidine kinase [Microbacterium azadirachtae]|uniref:Two-component system, NarL family, sensor histidine kinase DesK n=1 Tax=Microbacterium azadirachtae TaxID=582680 RepID=A0A1I6G559_9MICO|nr:histidine kinase [Microbacterium azadirachtae]SDL34371.1 two-component system, NarL family, sensor histidine kinase DesK [Microbacterium azadirachtae]SEF64857.1 two-component system, NarL family, sensor histidine kinase DesK [Microbacterium azadirachtae]SEF65702.1 two-component system, NarL family, sensor histidine kinase DesK [Microbacterium azadirachtae]SFR37271.1 two-component system, NarL family, sensor histidine kinase DesK [Microbacterium azadirachtae]
MTQAGRALTDSGTRRRIRHATILTVTVAVLPLGVLAVAVTSTSWWDGVVVALGLLAPVFLLLRWTPEGYPDGSILALVSSAASWGVNAALGGSPIAVFALSLAGAMILPRLPRHRVIAFIGLCAAAAAIGALAFITVPFTPATAAKYLLVPAAVTAFIYIVLALVERYTIILLSLERAKQAEAELAVAQERIRFAGDLHDIQGHTLHVIKLKTALARRLTHSSPDAANNELDEVQRLIAETITRTQDLVHAQRRLNIASELENAKNLLEATGITVTITTTNPIGDPENALLAQVLRETTTNILRHAHSTRATITIDTDRIEVINDGAETGPLPALGGLDTLRHRLQEAGGALDVARHAGRFRTTATAPATHPTPPLPRSERDR